ncbi:MAG: response regulator [Candidatus Brocadiales bacterium]|nr:response regulator [Candidatus Brocadiales bacterium]
MSKKTILLVEDNPDDVELTKIALKKEEVDCELTVMSDGTEVIDHLLTTDKQAQNIPDVILLDLKLIKMGGLELLTHLRRDDRTKLIPVVILSSSDEEIDITESYKLGANSYIRKPVNFEEFCETIRTLGKYWLRLNRQVLKPTG